MTDSATPAAPLTPAPSGLPSNPAPSQGPSNSPVNSAASASKANQQALAAGEPVGLHGDNKPVDPGTQQEPQVQQQPASDTLQVDPSPASLEPAPANFLHVETGNKIVDQVATLLQNQQFEGAESIISEIIETQELTLASKAELVKGLGADVANLVINQLETSVASVKEAGIKEGQRLKQLAMERFGGTDPEGVWQGIQKFAQSPEAGLSPQERQVMNQLLAEGGTKAELVIDSLATKYEQSNQYTRAPQLMEGTAISPAGFEPLSKADYQQQIGPAVGKYGEGSPEVQALRNRRAASISRGL